MRVRWRVAEAGYERERADGTPIPARGEERAEARAKLGVRAGCAADRGHVFKVKRWCGVLVRGNMPSPTNPAAAGC